MSGGSYDYAYTRVQDMAEMLTSAKETALRRAFGEHLKKVAVAMQAVEWVDSNDCAPGHEDDPIRACIAPSAELDAARATLAQAIEEANEVLARSEAPTPARGSRKA
jgi:hypothetical protein